MNIREIESLSFEEAKRMAIEVLEIKEHNCVIIDLGEDFFGYSVLVFRNGKHIHYANDYELHHAHIVKEKGREGLRDFYIKSLNNKLYTNEELMEPVSSYFEYEKKRHFLQNYWIMQYEYDSIFGIDKKIDKKKFPYHNPVCFCHVSDEEIVKESKKYYHHLQEEYKKLKQNDDEFRKMIRYELNNHEAGYTGRYDNTLESLGLQFDKLPPEKQSIVEEELHRAIKLS